MKGFTFLEIILRMRSVLCLVMGCDVKVTGPSQGESSGEAATFMPLDLNVFL
jgi:hypothetical protein